jgi:hypothetical protein
VLSFILGVLDPFININTDRPASYNTAGHRSRKFCTLQLEHKGSILALDLLHCSRDKNLARPHTNRNKQKQTIFLPHLVRLLRNESVKQQYQLQRGEEDARRNKLMNCMQYGTQYCRKDKIISIIYTATVTSNYTTVVVVMVVVM